LFDYIFLPLINHISTDPNHTPAVPYVAAAQHIRDT